MMNGLHPYKIPVKAIVSSVTRRRRNEGTKFSSTRCLLAWHEKKLMSTSTNSTDEKDSLISSGQLPKWLSEWDTSAQMDSRKVYRYLKLENFTEEELKQRFQAIAAADNHRTDTDGEVTERNHATIITEGQLQSYVLDTIVRIEDDNGYVSNYDAGMTQRVRQEFALNESKQLWNFLEGKGGTGEISSGLTETEFVSRISRAAHSVDVKRIWPLTLSMVMVGTTVGLTTPAMPFVVQDLGLTASEYGVVVSAFALSKMLGNIPFAVLVERDGRKPFLVYSMIVISLGVGGVGFASGFEHLYICRLLTGLGVAALSTANTMAVTDISNPLNRASTFAPIMSGFAAGTALGPALGGVLIDQLGINPMFYMVGVSYIFVAGMNAVLIEETKSRTVTFPWQHEDLTRKVEQVSIRDAFQNALGQWAPLLSEAPVRNVCIMNAFYWVALAGSQMTLLPLILTNPAGLAMSATQVGQVYMGMSAVQVLGNPLLAKLVDRVGKVPGIVGGGSLISTAMVSLPFCEGMEQMAVVLGMWAAGSSLLSTSPLAFISDKVDDAKRAQAIALLRTSGDVGFLIGASTMGALADWAGSMETAMQSSSAILVTATGWFAARSIMTAHLSNSAKNNNVS